jgi:hypothetical protein
LPTPISKKTKKQMSLTTGENSFINHIGIVRMIKKVSIIHLAFLGLSISSLSLLKINIMIIYTIARNGSFVN